MKPKYFEPDQMAVLMKNERANFDFIARQFGYEDGLDASEQNPGYSFVIHWSSGKIEYRKT